MKQLSVYLSIILPIFAFLFSIGVVLSIVFFPPSIYVALGRISLVLVPLSLIVSFVLGMKQAIRGSTKEKFIGVIGIGLCLLVGMVYYYSFFSTGAI